MRPKDDNGNLGIQGGNGGAQGSLEYPGIEYGNEEHCGDSPSIALARQRRFSHTVHSFGVIENPCVYVSALRLPLQCMHEIRLHVGPSLPCRLPPPCNLIVCSGLQAFLLTRSIPRLRSPLFWGSNLARSLSARDRIATKMSIVAATWN